MVASLLARRCCPRTTWRERGGTEGERVWDCDHATTCVNDVCTERECWRGTRRRTDWLRSWVSAYRGRCCTVGPRQDEEENRGSSLCWESIGTVGAGATINTLSSVSRRRGVLAAVACKGVSESRGAREASRSRFKLAREIARERQKCTFQGHSARKLLVLFQCKVFEIKCIYANKVSDEARWGSEDANVREGD
jgi:hypothetical protein